VVTGTHKHRTAHTTRY
jgi:hypothetical protein